MGLKQIILALFIYWVRLMYSLLHYLPIVGTILTTFDKIVDSITTLFNDLRRNVEVVMDHIEGVELFCFRGYTERTRTTIHKSLKVGVFMTFVVRCVVYKLPVVGCWLASSERALLRLFHIAVNSFRAIQPMLSFLNLTPDFLCKEVVKKPACQSSHRRTRNDKERKFDKMGGKSETKPSSRQPVLNVQTVENPTIVPSFMSSMPFVESFIRSSHFVNWIPDACFKLFVQYARGSFATAVGKIMGIQATGDIKAKQVVGITSEIKKGKDRRMSKISDKGSRKSKSDPGDRYHDRLAKLEEAVTRRCDILTKMDSEIANRRDQLAKLDADIADRSDKLAELDVDLDDKYSRFSRLESIKMAYRSEMLKKQLSRASAKTIHLRF